MDDVAVKCIVRVGLAVLILVIVVRLRVCVPVVLIQGISKLKNLPKVHHAPVTTRTTHREVIVHVLWSVSPIEKS